MPAQTFENLKHRAGPSGFHVLEMSRTGFKIFFPIQKDKKTDDALVREVLEFLINSESRERKND